MTTKIVQLTVDESFTDAIDDLAERTGKEGGEVIRDALNMYDMIISEWEGGNEALTAMLKEAIDRRSETYLRDSTV